MTEVSDETQAQLESIYRNRFTTTEAYREQVWRILTSRWFQKYIPRHAVVLDLGCGFGQFINNIQCGRKYGMDLNPATEGRLNSDVTFLPQDCSNHWEIEDETLDIVFTSNFFEHLPSKVELSRTMTQAFRCLKPNGHLIAMGPNIKYVGGAYWDFYDHYIPLTELSVKEALETAGFKVETAVDRFLPYTMVRARQWPLIFLRVYLAWKLLWKLLGKQFLVIARKPSPAR